MSNEEKILEILGNLQQDVTTMKSRLDKLEQRGENLPSKSKMSEMEIVNRMSNLLSAEEADAFGRFMDAEEARKAVI